MTKEEQEILEHINCTIGGKYIGKLKVIYDECGWQLFLFLNREMTPLILSYQGTWEQFKDYITTEMKARRLELIPYWNGIQLYHGT